MSRKDRNPPRGKRNADRRRKRPQGTLPELADLEVLLRLLPSEWGDSSAESPLEVAQALVFRALEAESPERQVALAKAALRVSADCADAYVLLGMHASSAQEALFLYEQGVAAGERMLGEAYFQEYAGQFWGVVETRPYMRARAGLADALWAVGRREEAVQHYQEMLRLDSEDHQGIRYELAYALLELGRLEELEQLLDRYGDDGSAALAYLAALASFRREGDTPRACQLLRKARKSNPRVPTYLTGDTALPSFLPGAYEPGSREEAIVFAARAMAVWRHTPGAISWLRKTLNVWPKVGAKAPRTPLAQQQAALLKLPQAEEDVWEVDVRRLALPAEAPAECADVYLLVARSEADGALEAMQVFSGRPSNQAVWNGLVQGMRSPKSGEARRPGQIHLCSQELLEIWEPRLRKVGIACTLRNALPCVDEVFQGDRLAEYFHWHVSVNTQADMEADTASIADLPQAPDEVWQADVQRLPAWITRRGRPSRPWIGLVGDVSNDRVLATDLSEEQPEAGWLWAALVHAMRCPAAGGPRRPGAVQVRCEEYRTAFAPALEAAGVQCEVCPDMARLEEMFDGLAEHLGGGRGPRAISRSPGMTPAHVGSFFVAAAEFYRQAPWHDVPGDTVIEVQCDKLQSGRWYAVIMGQSGMTLGLALYEHLDTLRLLLSGQMSEEENMWRTSGLSLTFDEAFAMAPRDLDAAEKYGWPVAADDAYPVVMRVNPGLTLRVPLVWELELVEGCLRTLPAFVKSRAAQVTSTTETAGGPLTLRLSFLDV